MEEELIYEKDPAVASHCRITSVRLLQSRYRPFSNCRPACGKTIFYDEDGHKVKEESYRSGELERTTVYENFDGRGKYLKQSFYRGDGTLLKYSIYERDYDTFGYKLTSYNASDTVLSTTVVTCSPDGQILSLITYVPDGTVISEQKAD